MPSIHAYSRRQDACGAVAELVEQLAPEADDLVWFFCSSHYDLPAFAAAVEASFPCPVSGCTTAGELSAQDGYVSGGVSAIGLRGQARQSLTSLCTNLCAFGPTEAAAMATRARLSDGRFDTQPNVGVMLIDGMSMLEERAIAHLQTAMPSTVLVGGSAGDDLAFGRTHVYHGGAFHENAAVVTLMYMERPHRVFRTQHLRAGEQRLVVTRSVPEVRLIRELDGKPAADAYAQAVGLSTREINQQTISNHPFLVRGVDQDFVRSIQSIRPDGSIALYCAVENGVVLRVGEPGDLPGSLSVELDKLEDELGEIDAILSFDCIQRRSATNGGGLEKPMTALMRRSRMVGFSTYGEQACGLHMNFTLTGLALGRHTRPAA